jgi:hypothetical protein
MKADTYNFVVVVTEVCGILRLHLLNSISPGFTSSFVFLKTIVNE